MIRIPELAPCGVYCGACPSFGKSCLGCADEGREQGRSSKWGCKVRVCCYEQEKKDFCTECEKFPCKAHKKKLLDTHPGDPRFRYRHEVPANFSLMKEKGIDDYLRYQKERWTCPSCGGAVHFYHYRCGRCKREVSVPDQPSLARRMNSMAEMARLIRYDELDKLLELYEVLHPEDPSVRDDASLKPLWDKVYNDPGLFCIVVEADGEIVSSCTLAVVKNLTRGLRPYGVVENVVTRPDRRRKGYATMALHKAIQTAKEQGCYKVMLLSGARDEATLRFYERAGFARGVKTGFIVDLK